MERTTKATVTLAAVERAVVLKNAHLPPDAKRRMVHAEYKRLKHCETVRQSRVRKKVSNSSLAFFHELNEQHPGWLLVTCLAWLCKRQWKCGGTDTLYL